eukprot:1161928-Pelagomonas_calceolata.AAC.3
MEPTPGLSLVCTLMAVAKIVIPRAIQPVQERLYQVKMAETRMSEHSRAMPTRWPLSLVHQLLVAKELRPFERSDTAIVERI